MKPIVAPIRPDDRGAEVANLQAGLIALVRREVIRVEPGRLEDLLRALDEEQRAQVYGGGTRDAVDAFQRQRLHREGGKVDEETAAAVNDALTQLGAFDAPREVQRRVVAGRVTQEDQSPFKGAVALFHESNQGSIRLGETTTDADGRYTLRYETLPGSDSGNASVAALDEAGRTLKSSDIGAGPLQVVDLVVPNVQPTADARRVEGRIAFDHGVPAQGLTLRLYRLGFGAVRHPEPGHRQAALDALPRQGAAGPADRSGTEWLLDWRDGKKSAQENGLHYLLKA